jgi:hypothetical protein
MNFNIIPKTVSYEGEKLIKVKENLYKYPEEAQFVKERAEKLMERGTYSVIYKKLIPPTKNPNDYMTMGTYWWPDPSKPDGLPYIRKDGIFNPDAKDDKNTYGAMANAAYYLAHAAYVFENESYADMAAQILRVWHIDEKTRMTPHAEFAQAIPGICEGRGIGIIDFAASHNVFDAAEILYALGALDEKNYNLLKQWYVDFINWMITSEKGLFEDNYFNNHGAWYDVQIIAAARFTNRPELAKRVAANAYRRRHKTHIMPDGSQPHELERTQAMSYSTMNLRALTKLASFSAKLGYKEYTGVDSEAGVFLLGKAVEFLYPYATDQSEFPYQQIKPGDFGKDICEILMVLFELTGDVKYESMAKSIQKPQYMSNVYPK